MEKKYEIQINYVGSEWCSVRDENNSPTYLFETQEDALQQWEKLQNQDPNCKFKLIEL